MKVLIGIPTRKRPFVLNLAKQLASYGDVVLAAEQDTWTGYPQLHCEVLEVEHGLALARNTIFKRAIAGNYDVVVECDDDVKAAAKTLDNFFGKINELMPQGVASVSSKARIYEFWDGPSRSNKDYEVIPRLQQLWAIRVDVVEKLGFFDLDTLEDVEYSLRLLAEGHVPVQIASKGMIHGHAVQRNKAEEMGGQSVAERLSLLDDAIDICNERYRFAGIKRKGEGSFSCKLDWKWIKEHLEISGGLGLGYEDKRGIKI